MLNPQADHWPLHRHVRAESVPSPVPQPHRIATWRCHCGAVEFDTYPVGPTGAEVGVAPIGRAWVTPEQLARLRNDGFSEFGSAV